MLIGKELLEKVEELEKLGHDDQFIFSACGYSSQESFNTAFFYSKNAKRPKSNQRQKEENKFQAEKIMTKNKDLANEYISKEDNEAIEIINYSFLDTYTKLQMSRIIEAQKSDDVDITSTWLNPVVGEYLLALVEEIFMLGDRQYSKEIVALACGYFDIKCPEKEFNALYINQYNDIELRENLKDEPTDQIKFIPRLDLFYIAIDTALDFSKKVQKGLKDCNIPNTLEGLAIFKGRWCIPDETHGGTVYIPKRIVKESKDWDYSKVDLKDFNFQNLIDEEMIPSKDPTYSDLEYGQELGLKEEQVKKLNLDLIREAESEVRDHIDSFSFNEPMKYIHVNQYWYLDHKLECLDWFEHEEIAEFHGLRYEDCDEASRWCDG